MVSLQHSHVSLLGRPMFVSVLVLRKKHLIQSASCEIEVLSLPEKSFVSLQSLEHLAETAHKGFLPKDDAERPDREETEGPS